jgi:hypothetical protein
MKRKCTARATERNSLRSGRTRISEAASANSGSWIGGATCGAGLAMIGHGVAPSVRAADPAPRKARIGRVLAGLVIQIYP